ncbi:MAG TPA: hypothetical protein VF657_19925 [Actinoplanes sp.]|jgi:hypothetical protein
MLSTAATETPHATAVFVDDAGRRRWVLLIGRMSLVALVLASVAVGVVLTGDVRLTLPGLPHRQPRTPAQAVPHFDRPGVPAAGRDGAAAAAGRDGAAPPAVASVTGTALEVSGTVSPEVRWPGSVVPVPVGGSGDLSAGRDGVGTHPTVPPGRRPTRPASGAIPPATSHRPKSNGPTRGATAAKPDRSKPERPANGATPAKADRPKPSGAKPAATARPKVRQERATPPKAKSVKAAEPATRPAARAAARRTSVAPERASSIR